MIFLNELTKILKVTSFSKQIDFPTKNQTNGCEDWKIASHGQGSLAS